MTESCMCSLDQMIEVVMPNSVKKFIYGTQFYSCKSLQSAELSNSIVEIPNSIFAKCNNLRSIIIPEGVTTIKNSAFSDCSILKTVYMPSTLTNIMSGAFSRTPSDIEFIFSDNSTVFIKDSHMYTLNFETVVMFFGEQENILIPAATKHINGMAYNGLPIVSVEFPPESQLASIGDSAFAGCKKLTNVSLPPNIQSIGASCFSGCTSLRSISLGSSIQCINKSLFEGSVLSKIIVPQSVTAVHERAFASATVSEIVFEDQSECSSFGELAFWNMKGTREIRVPGSVSKLGLRCFAKSEFTSVIFDSPTGGQLNLSISCFEGCKLLTKVLLPENCQKFLDMAFYDCPSLKEISLPPSVEEIGVKCFGNCINLSSFIINNKSKLKSILSLAFENCKSLRAFTATEFSGLEADGGILYNNGRTKIIAFLNANPMKLLEIEDGVESINRFVFKAATNLEKIIIPQSIRLIGMEAFEGCINLRELVINVEDANNLQIESNAFAKCTSLGCDSVKATEEVAAKMLLKGLLEDSLEHCPTGAFTASSGNCITGALFCVTLEYEGGKN